MVWAESRALHKRGLDSLPPAFVAEGYVGGDIRMFHTPTLPSPVKGEGI